MRDTCDTWVDSPWKSLLACGLLIVAVLGYAQSIARDIAVVVYLTIAVTCLRVLWTWRR